MWPGSSLSKSDQHVAFCTGHKPLLPQVPFFYIRDALGAGDFVSTVNYVYINWDSLLKSDS